MWQPSTDPLLPVLVCLYNGAMLCDVVVVPPVTSQCYLTSHYNVTLQCTRGVFVTPTPPGIMTSCVIVTPRLTFPAKFSGKMYPLKYDRWYCSLKEKEQVLSLPRRL
uniref:Putative secreted protein n=1 Tax=Ixodes ricinus TaxID=34613 RepID=A0A6B0UGQ0_IXORI